MNTARYLFAWLALLVASPLTAEQSQRFDDWELHYSVVNTTFLEPRVAQAYGITRGKRRAILNLALRRHTSTDPDNGPTEASGMLIQGKTWDLITNQPLEFTEVREAGAVYYIAEFKFINEEWRFFEVDFRPEGASKTYTFKFKQQVFIH
jgi:hypothetical protein